MFGYGQENTFLVATNTAEDVPTSNQKSKFFWSPQTRLETSQVLVKKTW